MEGERAGAVEPGPEIGIRAEQDDIRDFTHQVARNRARVNRHLEELGIDV